MKNGHLLVATDPLLLRKVCRVIGTNVPLRSSLDILRRTPLGRTSQNFPSTHSVELGLLASKDVMHRALLAHESPEPVQDDPSGGRGKVPGSSCARCSSQLHIHIRLLTQRYGEADLRCVVSSYSAGGRCVLLTTYPGSRNFMQRSCIMWPQVVISWSPTGSDRRLCPGPIRCMRYGLKSRPYRQLGG
jgi:hypothetical protein